MLLTITYNGENAADLGYLLHKNPARPQTAALNFGKAHVFYPEVTPSRCTAALLLDIDPLDLARGKKGTAGGLFDYVNDRPYVCSSFMSTAISRVFGTAMSGRCDARQELADSALDLAARLTMLPCKGDAAMLERVFAPLGYQVEWEDFLLDEQFPEWEKARYVNLALRGKMRLRDVLRHIYTLIPVFDLRKHYWIGEEEINKLLTHGEGWLENHPEKVFITCRYFSKLHSYSKMALSRLDRLDDGESGASDDGEDDAENCEVCQTDDNAPAQDTPVIKLNTARLAAVLGELQNSAARSVIDMGCGEGNFLRLLVKDRRFGRIAGTDVSRTALARASGRLKLNTDNTRVTLFQSSLTYRDSRFKGYDAAVVIEVIEHIDESRLASFASALFDCASPKTVVITTPNAEYNVNYPSLAAGKLRHSDHRFEWTRAQFRAWCDAASSRYGYAARYENIGDESEFGSPTQMAVFTK